MKQRFKKWVDKNFWQKKIYNDKAFLDKDKPFIDAPLPENKIIANSFYKDNISWDHVEYLNCVKGNIIIEPDYGFAIKDFREIIQQSHYYNSLFPSIPRLLKKTVLSNYTLFNDAILFDGQYGTNYFHFFTDVFNKLWVLDDNGIDKSIPLIISEKTFQKTYFQHLFKYPIVNQRQWYIQKSTEYIKVRKLYLSRPMPYKKAHWLKTLSLLKDINKQNNHQKRIFLNRSKNTGRYIENFDTIKIILDKYNFEVIDTDGMSLQKQIDTLTCTSHLISIHGAGNINILFAYPNRLNFLEICPENRIACQYYWLSNMLNFNYDCILGGKLPFTNVYPEKGFFVNPSVLEKSLIKLLKNK